MFLKKRELTTKDKPNINAKLSKKVMSNFYAFNFKNLLAMKYLTKLIMYKNIYWAREDNTKSTIKILCEIEKCL